MLPPTIKKNDPKAKLFIYTVSIIVFAAVVILSKVKLRLDLPFNPHVFATVSAGINSLVAVFLLAGLITVKQKKYELHKKIMMSAIILSVLFLLSYIAHHLLAPETKFGDVNHDGIVSLIEKTDIKNVRMIYYFILLTHIPLAGIILPFILFTAYRALIGEYEQHKKLTRITWPIWFYVAVTGVIVYLMISPYYS
jgi:putative membrane protein